MKKQETMHRIWESLTESRGEIMTFGRFILEDIEYYCEENKIELNNRQKAELALFVFDVVAIIIEKDAEERDYFNREEVASNLKHYARIQFLSYLKENDFMMFVDLLTFYNNTMDQFFDERYELYSSHVVPPYTLDCTTRFSYYSIYMIMFERVFGRKEEIRILMPNQLTEAVYKRVDKYYYLFKFISELFIRACTNGLELRRDDLPSLE